MAKRILKGTLALATGLVIANFVFGGRLPVQIANDSGAIGQSATPIRVAGSPAAAFCARCTTSPPSRRDSTVVLESATVHQCESTYYQPYNNNYLIVEID